MKQLYESIKDWMVRYKRNSVKLATYDRLLTSFKLMMNYTIAYIYLDVLCSDDIQTYLNRLVSDGYALTTIKKQYNLLTGFIKYANTEGLIARPIYNNVRLPSQSAVKKPKREVVAYDEAEQINLKRVLNTHEYIEYDVANLMMETGVRVGEALALTWSDVDWRRRAVKISKTLVRLGNHKKQFVQDGAKSYSSNRTIPLSTAAIELLKQLYSQKNVGKSIGSDHFSYDKSLECDLIFHDDQGQPLSYESMRWHITKACQGAGVPYYGQHVFRHTFATNCYNRGCDVKILSKLLGHSDVAVTYNTYIHLYGDTLEEMRSVLG